MDVLAGRKTGGIIEGDIRLNGHPKEQAAFARVRWVHDRSKLLPPQSLLPLT